MVRVSGRTDAHIASFFSLTKWFSTAVLSQGVEGSWQEATAELQCALRSLPLFPLHWQCMCPRCSRFCDPVLTADNELHAQLRTAWLFQYWHVQPNLNQPLATASSSVQKTDADEDRKPNSQATNAFLHIHLIYVSRTGCQLLFKQIK